MSMVGLPPGMTMEQLEAAVQHSLNQRKLDFYRPYKKQKVFHEAGSRFKERLFMAGNQLGKTFGGGAEVAMHATGLYPDWWEGRRFDTPTSGWTGSPTGQTSRDTVQRILLGRPNDIGTGSIPGRYILGLKKASGNVPDQYETISVRHVPTGGTSTITLKSYDQGRIRWQGETLHYVWFDEEPPDDIYSEGKTRTNATNGIVFLTFTPLLGMSVVVLRFLKEKPAGAHVTNMTIYDAEHYTDAQREAILAGYPAHEREARGMGIPMLGEGRVFEYDEKEIMETSIMIPPHWPRLGSLDLGFDHYTAVVWMAWDRDTDIVHLYDAYKVRQAIQAVHAAAINARGPWPIMWPHDAMVHDPNSGATVAQQYRDLKVNMHRERATHAPEAGQLEGTGGFGFEAGILDMSSRFSTQRLRVAKHLTDWFDEYRQYHREKGKVVKEQDDLMSATRVGLMMLRHAKTQLQLKPPPRRGVGGFQSTDPSCGVLG